MQVVAGPCVSLEITARTYVDNIGIKDVMQILWMSCGEKASLTLLRTINSISHGDEMARILGY